ncbi:MAG TPA: hypothetical protein VN627_12570, partial [Novosphingobium sp.]|nr:hypothetical protein [Novosphingobium sp.]
PICRPEHETALPFDCTNGQTLARNAKPHHRIEGYAHLILRQFEDQRGIGNVVTRCHFRRRSPAWAAALQQLCSSFAAALPQGWFLSRLRIIRAIMAKGVKAKGLKVPSAAIPVPQPF